LQAFELGPEARTFALEQLKLGHDLAAHLTGEALPAEWVALLPSDTEPSELTDFDDAVGSPDESLGYLTTVVTKHLWEQTSTEPYVVFEDPAARKTHPFLAQRTYKRLIVDSFVYPYLEPGATSAEVASTIVAIHGYPFIGVLSALELGQSVSGWRSDPHALLEQFARRPAAPDYRRLRWDWLPHWQPLGRGLAPHSGSLAMRLANVASCRRRPRFFNNIHFPATGPTPSSGWKLSIRRGREPQPLHRPEREDRGVLI
jgi:hypothetical protein